MVILRAILAFAKWPSDATLRFGPCKAKFARPCTAENLRLCSIIPTSALWVRQYEFLANYGLWIPRCSTTLRFMSLASEALGASWCFSIPKPDGWCSRWEARMVLAPKWTTWSWKERKAWHRQVVSPNRCTHLFCICFVRNHSIYIYIHKIHTYWNHRSPVVPNLIYDSRCLEECVGNYASCECFRFRKFPTEAHQNTFEQFGEHKKGGPNVL